MNLNKISPYSIAIILIDFELLEIQTLNIIGTSYVFLWVWMRLWMSQLFYITTVDFKATERKVVIYLPHNLSYLPRYSAVSRRTNRHISHIAESDNLGSTDSEVKKILTLHLPITEYEDDASDDASAPHSDSEPARLRPAHPATCRAFFAAESPWAPKTLFLFYVNFY